MYVCIHLFIYLFRVFIKRSLHFNSHLWVHKKWLRELSKIWSNLVVTQPLQKQAKQTL